MRIAIVLFLFLSAMSSSVNAQYVYLSPTGGCSVDGIDCLGWYSEFYVFLSSQGITNTVGTSFYVEGDEFSTFGPENVQSVIPHEGVVIVGGDIFSGIELSWPEGAYDSDTLLTVVLNPDNMPSFSVMVFTKNIQLFRTIGDPLALDDFVFFCSHCYGSSASIWWQHADTLTAVIGKQTTLDLPCQGSSTGGMSGTYLEAYDELGWVDECTHCSVGVDCAPCPWNVQHVLVTVYVPEGANVGDTSKLRVIPTGPCCWDDSTSVYVKAIDEIGTEERSWGNIKSLIKTE
jgi:hypothetical protein